MPVAVWVSDLDIQNTYKEIKKTLIQKVNKNLLSKETVNLFDMQFNYGENLKDLENRNNVDKKVSVEDSKIMIKVIREKFKEAYEVYFNDIMNKLQKKFGFIDTIFISHYAPYFQAKLTISQIKKMQWFTGVQKMYYFDTSKMVFQEASSKEEFISRNNDQDVNLTAAGIKSNIDNYNLTGQNVTIGVIDNGFSYPHLNLNFSRFNISTNVYGNISNSGLHGDYVSAIIGANNANFSGAVCDCDMYFANGSQNYPDSFEWLVDKGCNVINSSFLVYYAGTECVYESFAKWIDSVSQRAVVNIVVSAGNSGENSVFAQAMAYNAIVVGSCYNNNSMLSSSSYVNIANKAYKPDITAQGENAVSYTIDSNTGLSGCCSVGGTSSAAPLVTSAVAQLCQYSSLMMSNPLFVKSLILNGANYFGSENIQGSYVTFNAFNRQRGAGVLDASRSLQIYRSMNFTGHYINTTQDSFVSSLYVPKNMSKVKILLCSLKTNYAGSDVTAIDQVTEEPLVGFEVTVVYTGMGGYTYHSCYTTDNKVSVVFTPPKKGTYTIYVHAISNVGNITTPVILNECYY